MYPKSIRGYISPRHRSGVAADLWRDGLTITLLRRSLGWVDRALSYPHRLYIGLFLLLTRGRDASAATDDHAALYRRELVAIDLWTIAWPLLSVAVLYPTAYWAALRALEAPDSPAIYVLLLATGACLYRALDVWFTLIRLHLADRYVPHTTARAIVGTLCQFIDVTTSFAVTYIFLRVLLGKSAFAGSTDLLSGSLNSLYFSFVTASTLGFGDVYPAQAPSQLVLIVQLVSGVIFAVVIFQHVVSPAATRTDQDEGDSAAGALFYERFLDEFRHPESYVRTLFQSYVDDFRGQSKVLDLACGRGEFLETLRDAGVDAYGVDSNSRLVERCLAKGLKVLHSDWRLHLTSIPSRSLGGVFCAQFVEHLSSDELILLVKEAFRCLRDSGVLVVETLNPNLRTMVEKFHVDPTHTHLINPGVLQFIFRDAGFGGVQLRYLNYPSELVEPIPLQGANPEDAWGAVAKNFAIVAQLLTGPHYFAVIGRRRGEAERYKRGEMVMADFRLQLPMLDETEYELDWDGESKRWRRSAREYGLGRAWEQGLKVRTEDWKVLCEFFKSGLSWADAIVLERLSPGELVANHNGRGGRELFAVLCEVCGRHWRVFRWREEEGWRIFGRTCAFSWRRSEPPDENELAILAGARGLSASEALSPPSTGAAEARH